jgi:hypothetical protein
MGRLNHMFDRGLDLAELRLRSNAVVDAMNERLARMEREAPQAHIREFVRKLTADFSERPFAPLGDVWESELGDLFGGEEDAE